MDVLDLRIQVETTLADVLGSYRLANGAETPAIAVRAVGEARPAGTIVTGLEVVIVKDPEPVPVLQYQDVSALQQWTAYLVDWSGEIELKAVAKLLLQVFPGMTFNPVTVPRGVGPQAQLEVQIQTGPDIEAR